MSDQIKELVVKLRDTIMTSRGLGQSDEELVNPDGPEAASALEAMAGEVAALTDARDAAVRTIQAYMDEATKREARAERLRVALETIAEEHDAGRHDGIYEACPAHEADVMFAIARKALEDKQ